MFDEPEVELTKNMIEFLNEKKGSDLITAAARFRETFTLSYADATILIHLWMDL